MPLPEHLTTDHLRVGVVPDLSPVDPDDHRAAVAAVLTTTQERLDLRADLLAGWRGRLPLLPAPPRTDTLQEAVQAARARLRSDRADVDGIELQNRRFVVGHLLDGLR